MGGCGMTQVDPNGGNDLVGTVQLQSEKKHAHDGLDFVPEIKRVFIDSHFTARQR